MVYKPKKSVPWFIIGIGDLNALTSSVEITSMQNEENVKNAPNKRNAVISKKELTLKSKKKKSDRL